MFKRKRLEKTILVIFFAVIFCFLINRLAIGENVSIPSESMYPTVCAGDLVWQSKISYGAVLPRRMVETPVLNLFCFIPPILKFDRTLDWGYHRLWGLDKPKRMDVIVFKWHERDQQLYIKRIIGMPDDTIMLRKGVVFINHQPLYEQGKRVMSTDDYGPIVVLPNHYFVMGDNRSNSVDSRTNGLVPFECIVGRATYVVRRDGRLLFEEME